MIITWSAFTVSFIIVMRKKYASILWLLWRGLVVQGWDGCMLGGEDRIQICDDHFRWEKDNTVI